MRTTILILLIGLFSLIGCQKEEIDKTIKEPQKQEVMGKVLNIPNGISFSEIQDNSDIGDLSDNGDGSFTVTNIDTAEIRNVLGEDTNDVGSLYTSPKINRFSLYKPHRNYLDSGQIKYDPANFNPPYKMGEFAAYDHAASEDYITHSGSNLEYTADESGVTISATFYVNQMNWYAELSQDLIDHVFLRVKDGTTTVAEDRVALNDEGGSQQYSLSVSSITAGSYTCEVYFGQYNTQYDYKAPVPVSDWQWSCDVTELGYPTCEVYIDPDDSNLSDATIENTDDSYVTVDASYKVEFTWNGPGLMTKYVYAKDPDTGNWHQINSGVWKAGNTYTYTGTLPFDVYYGDHVEYMLSTKSY